MNLLRALALVVFRGSCMSNGPSPASSQQRAAVSPSASGVPQTFPWRATRTETTLLMSDAAE